MQGHPQKTRIELLSINPMMSQSPAYPQDAVFQSAEQAIRQENKASAHVSNRDLDSALVIAKRTIA